MEGIKMINKLIIGFILTMLTISVSVVGGRAIDDFNKEKNMADAFNDIGLYYKLCKDVGHDNSAQFNEKIYCLKNIDDGVIILYPIKNMNQTQEIG